MKIFITIPNKLCTIKEASIPDQIWLIQLFNKMITELNDREAFGGGGDKVVAVHFYFRNYMVHEWDQLDSQRILQNTSIDTCLGLSGEL